MPKPRKIRVQEEKIEAPKVTKLQKYEPEWMRGDGRIVVDLILSIQKSDINNVKVLAELTKLYKSVKF
jgi:hypothetical protein